MQSVTGVAFRDPPPFSAEVGPDRLAFYPGGHDRREAVLAMIRGAQHSLKLVFYIFAQDAIATLVRDELAAAARRGVKVLLILDHFGSSATESFLAPLREAGGEFRWINPRWGLRYLIRNHQKMIVADDARAIFGGFNIEDDYFAPPEANGWTDLAIAIEGPAVAGLVEWFAKLDRWTADQRPHYRAVLKSVRSWDWSGGRVRWLVGGPTRGLSTWARCVTLDMAKGDRLDMVMAYFSPPSHLLRRMGKIAERGETRLVMAAKSDNTATIGASRSLYRYLLRHKARVWEFAPCKLHTKLIVLDDAVYLGSANFDARSLYINLEIVLFIEDAGLARRLRQYMADLIVASREITPAIHAERATWWNRMRWRLALFLVAVIDYTLHRQFNLFR